MKKENENVIDISIVLNKGMFLYQINGETKVRFFKNKYGDHLKTMWNKLCEPVKRDRTVSAK